MLIFNVMTQRIRFTDEGLLPKGDKELTFEQLFPAAFRKCRASHDEKGSIKDIGN